MGGAVGGLGEVEKERLGREKRLFGRFLRK